MWKLSALVVISAGGTRGLVNISIRDLTKFRDAAAACSKKIVVQVRYASQRAMIVVHQVNKEALDLINRHLCLERADSHVYLELHVFARMLPTEPIFRPHKI
eukprot:2320442-Pleurochrysis_carterae.AAC.1